MIAKGNLHAHGVKLAAYLTTSKGDERAELVELRGFVADNIRDAFIDVQIQAEATNATKPFFHAYVRLPADETLTREQWQGVADRMEKRLGFEGQGRAIAFHYKQDGETHMHVAWSRIDLETMTAIDPGLYKNKMKELSRQLEKEFGLTLVANERDPADKTKAAGRNEFEQSRRLGTNLKDIRTTIHACWQSADNGKAFAASLDQQGLILARGDKRDFVIIDRDGGDHALSKRITGATASETRARLADIDRAALPSVDEAKATQRDRAREPAPVAERPLSKTAGDIRLAWSLSDSGKSFAAALDERGLMLAVVNGQEAYRSERVSAFAQAIGSYAPRYREGELVVLNAYGNAYPINQRTTGTPSAEIDKYLATVDRGSLLNMDQTRDLARHEGRETFLAAKQAARPLTKIETRILAAHAASKDGATFMDHLAQDGISLAKVTSGDLARRNFDREAFSVTATRAQQDEQTTLRREGLVPRPFEGKVGELVAVNRYGGIYRLNAHKIDTAALEARAAEVAPLRGVTETRDEKLAARAVVREERQIAQAERITAWERYADRQRSKTGDPLAKAGSTFAATGRPAAALASGAANVVIKTADLMLDSVMGFFTPPTEEQQRDMAREEAQRIARAAEAAQDERAESPPPPPPAKDPSIARPFDEDRDDDDHDYDFERERTWR